MPDGQLTGRVAVVTGAARGIGREIALALAAEGASLALASRSTEALQALAAEIVERGGRALAVTTDVRDDDDVDRLAITVERELGPVDLLVNNSGVAGPTAALWEADADEWLATIDVNLVGTYRCCRAFLPAMVNRRRGNVVVIGSVTGKRPLYGRTAYATSKLALVGMVRTLAWECGPFDVRVNLVSPGPTAGARIESVLQAQSERRGESVETIRAELTSGMPLARFVDPVHIAEAVLFLGSDAAASITGEDLNISAGLAMY